MAQTHRTITGRIIELSRRPCSSAGNPRYSVVITAQNPNYADEYVTAPNAAVAYEIGNTGLREGCKVTAKLNSRGQIVDMVAGTLSEVTR